MYGYWAQKFVLCLYIGPVAQSEDKSLFEKEISLSKKVALVNREISLGHNNSRGGPRISTSSANQCRGPKDCLSYQVTFQKVPWVRICITVKLDRKKSKNILGKSCCLCIKCTAANSLASLIWR